jgi:hypothetical protein
MILSVKWKVTGRSSPIDSQQAPSAIEALDVEPLELASPQPRAIDERENGHRQERAMGDEAVKVDAAP